jgi:CspA family cold shock protein
VPTCKTALCVDLGDGDEIARALIRGEAALAKGTVKFFNTSKGYGFIAPAGGGNDVFVHVSALQMSGLQALNEGKQVEYETETTPQSGKLQAILIRVL